MRPSMSGDNMWRMLYDCVHIADTNRQYLDTDMRMPRGLTSVFEPSVLSVPANESPEHYLTRMASTHLIQLNNHMLIGGMSAFQIDPAMNALFKQDSLDLVNVMRQSRGLPVIGPHISSSSTKSQTSANYQEVDKFLSLSETNKLHTWRIGENETYDVIFCRHTEIAVCDSLLDTSGITDPEELIQIHTLKKRCIAPAHPNAPTTIQLSPSYFDCEQETWMHRAIAFQELKALQIAKDKKCESLVSCNGSINACAECPHCIVNIYHTPDSSTIPTSMVNISHRQTLHENCRNMLLALTVLLPCIDCNFHFGLIERYSFMQSSFADFMFPYDLQTTHNSEKPTDEKLRSSDLFSKKMIREALIAASIAPPKRVKLKTSSSPASSSTTTTTSTTLSRTVEPENLLDVLRYDSIHRSERQFQSTASEVFKFHESFWANSTVATSVLTNMKKSKVSVHLGNLYPTGFIISQQAARIEKPSLTMRNIFGSLLFTPFHIASTSFSKHLHDIQNSVNATKGGKPQYDWVEHTSKRFAFGSALGNPAHVWPIIIAMANSIQPYYLIKEDERNACENSVEDYYRARYTKFVSENAASDDKAFAKNVLEPLYLAMYKCCSGIKPEYKEASFLDKVRSENDGQLPPPFITEEEGAKLPMKRVVKLTRLRVLHIEFLTMREVVKSMAVELEMNPHAKVHSWQSMTTPNAAIKAFNNWLSMLVPLFHANISYRSLVGHFWPIPREYMNRSAEFLIEGMWKWYHQEGRLMELVRDTVASPEHLKSRYSGDALEQGASGLVQRSLFQRQVRYRQFVNKVYDLHQSKEGMQVFADANWRMDDDWMNQFKSDYMVRFTGQLIDLKPMVVFNDRPAPSKSSL